VQLGDEKGEVPEGEGSEGKCKWDWPIRPGQGQKVELIDLTTTNEKREKAIRDCLPIRMGKIKKSTSTHLKRQRREVEQEVILLSLSILP